MSLDPLALMTEVDHATERLLGTAAAVGDDAVGAPSRLPGWTRGHVLTHLARNADSLVNLLTWARTGVVTPQYPSWERRERDIEAGAPRPLSEQVADLRDASARFAAAAAELPAEAWAVVLGPPNPKPAAHVVWRRLREVEVHHVDLGSGYSPADWSSAFGHRLLHDVATGFAGRDDVPPVVLCPSDSGHELTIGAVAGAPAVTGTACALAAWLTGRSTGADLTVSPPGELPTLPSWI